jgi:uncharacterized RDD family membrane protein YckC
MIWEIDEGRAVVEGLDEDGRPDPAYAAALGLKPAPLGRRALASIIEFALYAFLQLPYWLVALPTLIMVATGAITAYGLLNHPNLVWMVVATSISLVLTMAFVIVQIVLHGRRGVTLGKAFTGIRSVNVATLERPGMGRAFLRALVLYCAFLVPLVGPVLFFLSPLFDRERRGRGWLDKVGGTWFVDIKRGLDPYHEKRMRIARKTVRAEPEAPKSELPSLATPADRMAQPYRPGARTSSGVVGAARPQSSAPHVGLASQPQAEPAPSQTVPGMPAGGARLGGYRPGELSGVARPAGEPSAPAAGGQQRPLSGGIVDSVPGREHLAAPTHPPAPQAPGSPAAAQPTPTSAAHPAQAPASPSAWQRPAAPAEHSHVSDETVIEPDLDGEIDDRTVRRVEVAEPEEDLEATRARPASRRVVAMLAFDSGDRFAITGAALVGRNPAPSQGEVVDHLLPIADETRSISKTHLLITAAPLAAVDRASTNGSSVVRGGTEHPLRPGDPFALVAGDVMRFGDRTVTIEPGEPGGAS